jgi:hypothetical protein
MAEAGGSCQEMVPPATLRRGRVTAPTHCGMSKARRPATPFPATNRGLLTAQGLSLARSRGKRQSGICRARRQRPICASEGGVRCHHDVAQVRRSRGSAARIRSTANQVDASTRSISPLLRSRLGSVSRLRPAGGVHRARGSGGSRTTSGLTCRYGSPRVQHAPSSGRPLSRAIGRQAAVALPASR